MGYKHLTEVQRSQIQVLKSMGHTQQTIAEEVGVHPSTISRELKRNTGLRGYRYQQAHRFATQRCHEANIGPYKMTASVVSWIESRILESQWSPEQISGLLSANQMFISHTTIYKHIWTDRTLGGTLYKQLRHRGKKYNYKSGSKSGRGCIPNRIDISKRPRVVDKKQRIGDWEGDTIIGKAHRGAIVSLVDRKSKFTLLKLVADKSASSVTSALIALFSNQHLKHTVTFDNGKEFSSHEHLNKETGVQCFFAQPYHSWERGLNEHTNGLVGQYLPKQTDFTKVDECLVREIQEKLNNRPRKVLGWRTPNEVMLGKRRPQKIALHG